MNVPTSQLGYYFLSLAISGLVHEVGHAIATTWYVMRVASYLLLMYVIIYVLYACMLCMMGEQEKDQGSGVWCVVCGVWYVV